MKILLDKFKDGKCKALTMSYDDGVAQDARLIEIFNRNNIKGTFNINGGLLDGSGTWTHDGINISRIREEEIAEVYKGHEIAAHSYTHPHLQDLPLEDLVFEIIEDRKKLERLTKYPVRGLAYPFGSYSNEVINTLKCLGIDYARVVNTTQNFQIPMDFYKWEGTCHHDQNLMELGEKFLDLNWQGTLALMYVWGHSYEFDINRNWSKIETFCEMMSGRDDIWYATNIEIVDYLKAIKQVRFSADKNIAYNMSSMDVWFSADGIETKIKSGEIINLT